MFMYIYMSLRAYFLALGHMCKKSVIKYQHEVVVQIGRVNTPPPPGFVDHPRMAGVRLVDWCTRQPTRRALKTGSCSGLHTWIVHAWEVFD